MVYDNWCDSYSTIIQKNLIHLASYRRQKYSLQLENLISDEQHF